jgi:hypothetical protein
MNGDQQQASGTALLAIVNRRAVLGAGARPSRVTAWPFVKSARLLSAEGHPADAVIEMWRPDTDEWVLRGRLGAVAATVIDGETASRLRQEWLAGSRSREERSPRGLLLVHVHHPRAVSGAADDNGERGNVKPIFYSSSGAT